MADVFKTMIVEAAYVQDARDLAVTTLGLAGEGMWPTSLSPTGQAPLTHYISSGFVDSTLVTALEGSTFVSHMTLSNSSARTVMRDLGLSIYTPPLEPLTVVVQSTFNASVGVSAELPLTATGGFGSYVFGVWYGTLPDGLSLVDNAITGVPTTPGTYEIGVSVSASGETDTEIVVITIT